MKLRPVRPEVDFPALEARVLEHWDSTDAFQKSVEQRPEEDRFVFYDGPPFATGLPHYGHFVASVLKDIVPRYWAMKGKRVERRWGWDCHGLPVENETQKELGLASKADIDELGIERFNEACRGIVLRYTGEWRQSIRRLGRWVDHDRGYKTMEPGAPRVDTAATFFEPTLKAWNIPYTAMHSDDDIDQIDAAFKKAAETSLPTAVLIVPETA